MKLYQKIKLSLPADILCLLFINSTTAVADPCDTLTGQAKGLCMAYTQGMKCNTAEPSGSDAACARIEQKIVEETGEPLPWTCPTFTSESIVFSYQSNADNISRVSHLNKTLAYSGSQDYSLIVFGSGPWHQWLSGLSYVHFPGEYLSWIRDYTGVDNQDVLSLAQSDACRVEVKDAYATIKNIACPGGATYPSACATLLTYCDDDIAGSNRDLDPGRCDLGLPKF